MEGEKGSFNWTNPLPHIKQLNSIIPLIIDIGISDGNKLFLITKTQNDFLSPVSFLVAQRQVGKITSQHNDAILPTGLSISPNFLKL